MCATKTEAAVGPTCHIPHRALFLTCNPECALPHGRTPYLKRWLLILSVADVEVEEPYYSAKPR